MGKKNNIFDKFKELDKKYYRDAVRRAEDALKMKEEITQDIEGFLSESDKTEGRHDYSHSTSLMLQEKPYTHEELLKQLVTDEELNEIRAYLNRPLYERIKWTKGDYIVVFIATAVGIGIEGLNLIWRPNSPVGDVGDFNERLNKKFHENKHSPDCPIDYQGIGFKGGTHRVRTRGHDVTRFLDALKQVKNGEFNGVRWHHKQRIGVITSVNQYGKEYPTKDLFDAFWTLVNHLFRDFFSANSLPFPGSSFIAENGSPEIRAKVFKLYNNGYNLRHFALNTIEVFLAILVIKIRLLLKNWKKYGFKSLERPEIRLQEYEMRAAVMGALTGANLAECAVFRNPYLLNIPVLISTVDSAVQMLHRKMDRNSTIMKAQRNMDDILAVYKNWSE